MTKKKVYPLVTDDDVRRHALLAGALIKPNMALSKIHEILDGVDEYVGTHGLRRTRLHRALRK